MLDFLSQIPDEWRPLALLIFVVGGAVSAVMTYHKGKKAGPETQKVQEFAVSGQLADMGPVKELIEGVGLLVQQMVRANINTEAMTKAIEANTKVEAEAAAALNRFADAYLHRVEDEQREKEIADEVDRRLRERK